MRKLKQRELLRFFPRNWKKIWKLPAGKRMLVQNLCEEHLEAGKANYKLQDLKIYDLPPLKKHQPLYDGGYDKFVTRGHANAMVRNGIRTMDSNALRFKYFPGDRWIDHEYWRERIYHRTVHSEKLRLNRANRRRLRQRIHKEQEDFDWSLEERIEQGLLWDRSYFHRRNKHQIKTSTHERKQA